MALYGSDWTTFVNGVPDLDPLFGDIDEERAVLEVAARRLMTPRGTLPGDPDFGTDLRVYLSARITPLRKAHIRQDIESELRKDERVLGVSVSSLDVNSANSLMTVSIVITTASGPFKLTLQIDQVTVSILAP